MYNVEKFLVPCVESVVSQTFKPFEVILVDDGSTDASGAICDELAEDYAFITCIHKDNGGLSDARNVAIDKARGELLTFVDSDDVLDCRMFELLVGDIAENKADIAVCQMRLFKDGTNPAASETSNMEDVSVLEAPSVLPGLYANFTAWGKIYKRELFKEIRYPLGKLYEDARTMYKLAGIAKRATVRSDELYFCRYRPGSIMRSFSTENYLDRVSVWDEIISYLEGRVSDEVLADAKRQKNRLVCELLCCMVKAHILGTDGEVAQKLLNEIEWDAYKKFPPSLKVRAAIGYCRIVVR